MTMVKWNSSMDIYAQKNFMCLCVRTASHTQTVYVLLRIFNDQSMYGHNKTVANGFSHCVAYVLCDEIQVSSDSTSIPCLSDRSSVRVCVFQKMANMSNSVRYKQQQKRQNQNAMRCANNIINSHIQFRWFRIIIHCIMHNAHMELVVGASSS